MCDCSRALQLWQPVKPIEGGEHHTHHYHADGQPQKKRRYVVNLVIVKVGAALHQLLLVLTVYGVHSPSTMICHASITKDTHFPARNATMADKRRSVANLPLRTMAARPGAPANALDRTGRRVAPAAYLSEI